VHPAWANLEGGTGIFWRINRGGAGAGDESRVLIKYFTSALVKDYPIEKTEVASIFNQNPLHIHGPRRAGFASTSPAATTTTSYYRFTRRIHPRGRALIICGSSARRNEHKQQCIK